MWYICYDLDIRTDIRNERWSSVVRLKDVTCCPLDQTSPQWTRPPGNFHDCARKTCSPFSFSTHFSSFLLYIFLTCMLRVKSASVKALLSEEASDGKRKVRKMIIWRFELICILGMGMCGRWLSEDCLSEYLRHQNWNYLVFRNLTWSIEAGGQTERRAR